jgi:hypothetical protein
VSNCDKHQSFLNFMLYENTDYANCLMMITMKIGADDYENLYWKRGTIT